MKRIVDDKTIRTTEIFSACAVIATGLFLMLCGLDVLPFPIEKCWLISILACLFVISLMIAFLQKNGIGVTFSLLFGVLIVAQILVTVGFEVRSVYPVYVMALPVALAGGAIYGKLPSAVVKAALALVGVGLLLLIESLQILDITIVLPIIVVYLGLLCLINAIQKLNKKKESNERKND